MIVTPACTILGILHTQPGTREQLLEILHGFVEQTRREPGCIDYDFHVSDDDPNQFESCRGQ